MSSAGLVLTVEGEEDQANPAWEACSRAVDSLSAERGSAFLILVRDGKDYVQAAGGDDAFTVEWREHPKGRFRHWVAGSAGSSAAAEASITMTCSQVTVPGNERLSTSQVKEILSAFHEGKQRPASYAWREITRQFT